MEDRCVACGAVIPEGQQVCRSCMKGGGKDLMKNASGAPVPTEDAAIGNITREKNRYIDQIFEHTKNTFSLLGFHLVHVEIQDKRSGKKYKWPRKGAK